MSNAAFVLIAVAVIIVVSVLLWLLNRKPQTFMSSIDDFEREMKALGGETSKANRGGPPVRQRRRAISPSARHPGAEAGQPGGAATDDPVGGSRDDQGADTSGEPQP